MIENNKVRLHFLVDNSIKKDIERLKDLTNADSLTEVFKRAISVYKLMVDEKYLGHKLYVKENDGQYSSILIL